MGLSKGPWTPEEDLSLIKYIEAQGEGNWRTLPMKAGLLRCGKGCRLRWMNYLRPNVKRGYISPDEEDMIIRLHKLLGNRWSLIAGRISGRTDNEVKNYWNTHLRKKFNATKDFTHNARALRGKQPGLEQDASDITKCGGGTINPLCMIEKAYSFSPYKVASSHEHAVKDENTGSAARWDLREIVSILMGDEDLCERTEVDIVAIENFKQSIDGFHDTMDLNTSTINHIDTAWPPYGNHHSSCMPSIYWPEFEPYKTCPSDSMIRAVGCEKVFHIQRPVCPAGQNRRTYIPFPYQLYTITSVGQQLDGSGTVSANINSRENPRGDVSNLQSKLAAEAQIQVHIPQNGLICEHNSMAKGCDVFDQCSFNTVWPELGENMSIHSCSQPEDAAANQCSLLRDMVGFL